MNLRLEQLQQARMWRHTAIQSKPCGSESGTSNVFNYDPIGHASLDEVDIT